MSRRNGLRSESAAIRMQIDDAVLMVIMTLTVCQKWFLIFPVD